MLWVECQTQELPTGDCGSGGSLGLDQLAILISLVLHSSAVRNGTVSLCVAC